MCRVPDKAMNVVVFFSGGASSLNAIIVTEPLLTEYENRVLNVHPADLAILSGDTSSRFDASHL